MGEAVDTVTVTTTDQHTILDSPYHRDLPALAKDIGGRWDAASKTWRFDARDEQRVRDLAVKVYGTDGTAAETVTVRVRIGQMAYEQSIWYGGRRIAHRPGRDDTVRLGDGVIVVEGKFRSSGGSVKNPRLGSAEAEDVVLEVRDLPAGHPDLAREHAYMTVEVLDRTVDVDALLAEREQLLSRVAEIDAQLPEPEGTEVSTQQAAQALGVSVRTVQRWAQAGKVQAAKDPAGRWVITITIGQEA